jgi:hypothetical protein
VAYARSRRRHRIEFRHVRIASREGPSPPFALSTETVNGVPPVCGIGDLGIGDLGLADRLTAALDAGAIVRPQAT